MHYYLLAIQEAEPTNPPSLLVWVKPSIGQAFIRIVNNFLPFAGGEVITSFVEGYYWRSQAVQEEPPAAEIGKIWIKESIHQEFMYFTNWSPFVGG